MTGDYPSERRIGRLARARRHMSVVGRSGGPRAPHPGADRQTPGTAPRLLPISPETTGSSGPSPLVGTRVGHDGEGMNRGVYQLRSRSTTKEVGRASRWTRRLAFAICPLARRRTRASGRETSASPSDANRGREVCWVGSCGRRIRDSPSGTPPEGAGKCDDCRGGGCPSIPDNVLFLQLKNQSRSLYSVILILACLYIEVIKN